jgi:hypothetical protein
METSKKSTGQQLFDQMSYVADIPANLLASQVKGPVNTTHAIYGLGCAMRLASYDPDTQSWKMYGDISLWAGPQLLENLPASGMMRNGILYQLPQLVRLTAETESSLLPTPTATNVVHPEIEVTSTGRRLAADGISTWSVGLADLVLMWPTPTASSWGSRGHLRMLDKQVASGDITPKEKSQMSAGNGGKLNPMWVEWLMGFPIGWTDLEDSATP